MAQRSVEPSTSHTYKQADHNSLLFFSASVYNFPLLATKLPPSIGTTVPVTHLPPFPDNHRQAAATSSGLPMVCMGSAPAISASWDWRVAAIILERKGPRARVLTVMEGPSWEARCLESLSISGVLVVKDDSRGRGSGLERRVSGVGGVYFCRRSRG